MQRAGDSSTRGPTTKTITLSGNLPAELWNRLGTRVLPKLRTGKNLKIGIDFSVTVEAANANDLQVELKQILTDLGLQDSVELEQVPTRTALPLCKRINSSVFFALQAVSVLWLMSPW